MMKNRLIIIALILSALMIQSCTDILGTDPDVGIDPIDPPLLDSLLKINDQYWTIIEYAKPDPSSIVYYSWYDNYENNSIVYLDTTSKKQNLHFKVSLETTIDYKFFSQRKDRIILVEFNMNDILPELMRPNLGKGGTEAAVLLIIEKQNGEKIVLDEDDVVSYVEVAIDDKTQTITGTLKFAPYLDYGFETRQIVCEFEFKY
jgi:predicted small secreted protein